jgi:hypothetical protein
VANSQAMCTSFKVEMLDGIHALGTTVTRGSTTADVIKAALFLTTGSLGAGTLTYSAVSGSEVSGSGYSAGGVVVVNGSAPSSTGTTAWWNPSASIVYSSVTLSVAFDCVLIYNSSQGNRAISVHTFGAQTIGPGTFTLTMPPNDSSNALIRIS